MNSIFKCAKIPNVWLKNNTIIVTAVRNRKAKYIYFVVRLYNEYILDFNKDYLPGHYPKTEKERSLAAKYYDVPLQEYKPIKDDGEGAGDYPDFPLMSQDSKDPYYPWDNPEHKRNFNEVVS